MRSWLFVPGDSEKKIVKGREAGADVVILDLEDSVALAGKVRAREVVGEALKGERGGAKFYVRVNPLGSEMALEDLKAVMPAAPDGIVLPKTDSGADVEVLGRYLEAFEAAFGLVVGATRILPIATETAKSVFALGSYGGPRLAGLTWGAEDLPAAVGASSGRVDGVLTDLCRMARVLCLAGAAVAGVGAVETVYADFRDLEGLRAYAARGRREGFLGMMAIHPDQVGVINEVMTPSESEVAWARRVVAAFEGAPGAGVLQLDGKMLDMPHLKAARRVLGVL